MDNFTIYSTDRIVIEVGEKRTLAGLSSDPNPRIVLPSTALDQPAVPIYNPETFQVDKWDAFEGLYGHILNKLEATSENQSLIFVEPLTTNDKQRETLAQILFEKHHHPAVSFVFSSSAQLRGSGVPTSTGIVVDLGLGAATSTSVYEGHSLVYSSQRRTDLSFSKLSARLSSLLGEQAESYEASLLHAALDYEAEQAADERLKLKDGNGREINAIKAKVLEAVEALFQPQNFGWEGTSLTESVAASGKSVHVSARDTLFKNVVLVGTASSISGLDRRVEKDLQALVPVNTEVKVHRSSIDELSSSTSFSGAQKMVSDAWTPCQFVSSFQYHEEGPIFLHRVVF